MTKEKSSWKNIIAQHLSGPAITATAQKRRHGVLFRRVLTILGVLLVVAGVTWCVYYLQTHSQTFAPYAQDQGRTRVVFFSDGQLSEHWFDEQFGTLKQKDLLSIDIGSLQRALLKNPQVLEATVERHFPRTLKVMLRERLPLGRIKLKLEGKLQTYYVARDGELFSSALYKAPGNLPYFSGANIRQDQDRLSTLGGMTTLGELIDGLKKDFATLHVQLTQIDLSDWQFPVSPQTSVTLQLRGGTKLRFGPEKINLQLQRLKETLELLQAEKQSLSGKLIDLTYPDIVTIVGGGK